MKKTLIIITSILFLFSCGKEEETEKIEKKEFFVQSQKLNSFGESYKLKKTGKIKPTEDIILTSKANGRINSINFDFGNSVKKGEKIIGISDTIANYGLNLEKTNLSIESSKINYEKTEISYDKMISDAKINLEKLEKDYEILEKTIEENTKSSKINLEQSLTDSNLTTTSSIQIEKLENTIKKAEADLEDLKQSNIEQIKSFETTSYNDFLNLKNLYIDVISFSDSLLGVTNLNKRKNDDIENYLGKKDSNLTKQTEQDLLNLINFKENNLDSFDIDNIDINNIEGISNLGDNGYGKIISFLDNLEKVLDYSIANVNFTQTQIDAYKYQITGYKTSLSGKYNSFLNFKATVDRFLNTYKNSENSNDRQVELLKKDLELLLQNSKISSENAQINYNKTLLNNENQLNSLEVAVKNAKLNLENAKKNKEINLKQIQNQIDLAKNTRNTAYKEYSKLSITSPITGVISEVLVDVGQDVNSGTPLVKISSLGDNEIEISLGFKEIGLIEVGNEVEINYLSETLSGAITSISKIADENLNYKAKISVDSKVNISGNIVDIFIPIKLKENLIPLENLKVQSDKIGEINILSPHLVSPKGREVAAKYEINKQKVEFGKFYGEYVEILSCVNLEKKECDNLEIITNDISKFDESKFELKVKE